MNEFVDNLMIHVDTTQPEEHFQLEQQRALIAKLKFMHQHDPKAKINGTWLRHNGFASKTELRARRVLAHWLKTPQASFASISPTRVHHVGKS